MSSSIHQHLPNRLMVLFILLFCIDYGYATPLRGAFLHKPRQVNNNQSQKADPDPDPEHNVVMKPAENKTKTSATTTTTLPIITQKSALNSAVSLVVGLRRPTSVARIINTQINLSAASRYSITAGLGSSSTSTSTQVLPIQSVSAMLDHASVLPTRMINSTTVVSSTSSTSTLRSTTSLMASSTRPSSSTASASTTRSTSHSTKKTSLSPSSSHTITSPSPTHSSSINSRPSPSRSPKTAERSRKAHQSPKTTVTAKSTSKAIAPIPTASDHDATAAPAKHDAMSARTHKIVDIIIPRIIGGMMIAAVGGSLIGIPTVRGIFKWLGSKLDGGIKMTNDLVHAVTPPGTPPVRDFDTATIRRIMSEHPNLAPEAGSDWFARGRVQAPAVGSTIELPAGGAELYIHPNQAFEVPAGTILESTEDGSFVAEMSGALQRCENSCSEAGSDQSIQMNRGEPYQFTVNNAPEGTKETAQWRAPHRPRMVSGAPLSVKPPGDRALKVTNQRVDSVPDGRASTDTSVKRSSPALAWLRRQHRVRQQGSVVQFLEWNEGRDGKPPAPVGPKPPTTLHEYVALLIKHRAEDEARDYTASLLAESKKHFEMDQAARNFVESLRKAEAEKAAKEKAEENKKAKAEKDARARARTKAKAEQDARVKAKAEQDARDKLVAEWKAKEEKRTKEKADAERKRKEQQENERRRKHEEEERKRKHEQEERKHRQEAEDRKRKDEAEAWRKEEDRKRKEREDAFRRSRDREEEEEKRRHRTRPVRCRQDIFDKSLGKIGEWLHMCRGAECYCW